MFEQPYATVAGSSGVMLRMVAKSCIFGVTKRERENPRRDRTKTSSGSGPVGELVASVITL